MSLWLKIIFPDYSAFPVR